MWLNFASSITVSFSTEKLLEILKEYSEVVWVLKEHVKINTSLNSINKMKVSSKGENIHSERTNQNH